MVALTQFEGDHPLLRLFPALREIDARATETKLVVAACATAVTLATFLLSYLVSFNLPVFRALKTKEKVFWCLSVVRSAFGAVIVVLSGWYWVMDPTLSQDVVKATTQTSFLTASIIVGFFVFEVTALAISDIVFRTFDPALFAHHWLCLVGCSTMCLYYEIGHFFGIQGVMLEMTTPFSCLCWVLLKSKMARTTLWKCNQLFLIHLFHMRTIIEGYMLLMTYRQWDSVMANMPVVVFVLLYTQVVLQFVWLTPYWTYKKTSQFFNPIDFNQSTAEKGTKGAYRGKEGMEHRADKRNDIVSLHIKGS
ncbi:hypothetical protein EMCRGX_G002552 [Ephydatia muelleri]